MTGEIIEWDPAEIVEIKVGDLTAPVAVGSEMSKLYLASDQIVKKLIADIKEDEEGNAIIPLDLLPWFKEQRFLLSEIHKMTEEVQQKAQLKKMELSAKVFADYFKDLPQEQKVKMVKQWKKKQSSKT